MKNLINSYFHKLKDCIDNLDINEIQTFIDILFSACDAGKNIYIMGNGGSGSTASHFCCDFNKGMSHSPNKKFKMICLNDNIPTILAYANDLSYDDIFVEQLKNFLQKDDVVIGISGSGNSKNIIKAIIYANEIGATTIGLTGYDGGILKQIAKYSINTNVDDMQVSEDIHIMLGHLLYFINSKTQNNNAEVSA